MLKPLRALIWLLERAAELALFGWLMYIMFGDTKVPGWEGQFWNVVRNMMLGMYAYVVSGYAFTTFWLRVFAKPRPLVQHVSLAVLLYVFHAAIFFVGSNQLARILQFMIFGTCFVVTVGFIGNTSLKMLGLRDSSNATKENSPMSIETSRR